MSALVLFQCRSSFEEFSDDGSEDIDFSEFLGPQYSDWSTSNQEGLLQFEVDVQFNIPDIVIKPSLHTIQDGVQRVAAHLVEISKTIMWWAADVNESFHRSVEQDSQVNKSLQELSTAVTSNSHFALIILLLSCLSQKIVFLKVCHQTIPVLPSIVQSLYVNVILSDSAAAKYFYVEKSLSTAGCINKDMLVVKARKFYAV